MCGAISAAVITVAGSAVIANQQKKAAKGAANAQGQAAQAGINEQRSQWDAIQAMLAPYVKAGTGALGGQQDLIGLNGAEAQQKAIDALQNSPQFQALTQQGENAILSRASATGGLRGGNVQAALGQFRPQLLTQLIEQRYGQLGQIAGMGQASAAGQAQMGQQQGVNIAGLLGQMGQAQAGGVLGQGAGNAGLVSGLSQFGGQLAGMDWSRFAGQPQTTVYGNAFNPSPVGTIPPAQTF